MCCVRKFLMKEREQEYRLKDWIQIVLEYVCCCVLLNLILLLSLALFRHNTQEIYDKLNAYSDFALKYLILSVSLAVVIPFLEKYLRENVILSLAFDSNSRENHVPSVSRWIYKYGVYLLAVIAIGMHFVRIFDSAFWGDEAIPLSMRSMEFSELIYNVAAWGQTPLHYIIIWVLYRIFGDNGPMYHFGSLFPYIIIVLVSVTLVRKWFGKRTAAILILLSALLENAIQYNVEVKMYSWCEMFILMAYLMMYKILQRKRRRRKTKYFILMSLFSIGAVYSHSFALAVTGILYIFMLVYVAVKDKYNTWKVFLSGGSVLLFFLPWLLYCYSVRGEFVTKYTNIPVLSWNDYLKYIFASKYSLLIFAFFAVIFLITLIRDSKIINIQYNDEGKKQFSISLNSSEWYFSSELIWLLAGTFATFGVIILGEVFEYLFYPIILLRYLYPAFILVWLCFAICISKCKPKKMLSGFLTILLLVSCVPTYIKTVKNERQIEAGLERTLAATDEILNGGGILLQTNLMHARQQDSIIIRICHHTFFLRGKPYLNSMRMKQIGFF